MQKRATISRACAALAALLLVPCLGAQQTKKTDLKAAEKAIQKGDKLLAAGDRTAALAQYDEAVRLAPGNMDIAQHGAALRSRMVREHMDAAENEAVQGDLGKATQQIRQAQSADPGNQAVAERLKEMKAMLSEEKEAEGPKLAGVPKLKPSRERKDLDVRGDTRSAYENVAQAFGIAVAFDPDLQPKPVRLRVKGVDFYTAMELLGAETTTFWRPLNATLLFVTMDTLQKRRDYALQAEQTFPLPDAVGPEEMTEALRILRDISGATHVELDTKSKSITVRDTVERVMLAGELIRQMVKGRGELMLDIQLLEVDSTLARQLGITPSTSVPAIPLSEADVTQLAAATTLNNLVTILQQIFNARGITTPANAVIPVGGGKSTYLLGLPSATANFSEALSLVRSGREVLLRSQDGKPATFFLGQRFPVTLSLLSASLGGTVVGGVPTGTTFPRTDFAVGSVPVSVVANDLNNDGQRDLAVANSGDSTISVLLNQGGGNFTQAPGSPITLGANEQGPVSIQSATFRLTDATHLVQPSDLVIANSASNTVSVLLGNGDGTFVEAPGSPFPAGSQPRSVVIGDFNGDGLLDFAVSNTGDNTISTFQGNGDGTFTPFPNSPFTLATSELAPTAMVLGNFVGQGTHDLAVVNQATNNVAILSASGTASFNGVFTEAVGSPIPVGQLPVAIAAGDLNADAIDDLAVVNQTDNTVSVLLNNGDGTFVLAPSSPLPTSSGPSGVSIADFTQDGLGDIAVTNTGVNTLGIYLGLGSGQFSQRLEFSTPAGPDAVTTADLNGDGLPDAAITSHATGSNFVSVLLDNPAFASSAVSQVPFPGSEYIDLGVKVKATPVMNGNDDVTLQLEFEIRSLAGSSVNGIPVLNNQTLSQTVRLREDETSLIGGLLDKEQTRSITGIPGFADIPGFGQILSTKGNSGQDTELLILVTPRRLHLPERDARAIFAGRGKRVLGEGGGGIPGLPSEGLPAPPQPPPQQQQQPVPAPQPEPSPPPQPEPEQQPPEPQPQPPPNRGK